MAFSRITGRYATFLAYLVVIVLINAAGITLFLRFDLTDNKMYSLSEASRRVVSTLSEPLSIKVFFTRNLPAPHNATERYLRDLLAEYAQSAGRYFNYRFYNVSADEGDIGRQSDENQQLAQNYGVFPVQIQAIEKDEVKFQKAYMGMVLIHGDIIERIPTITTTDGLEYRLTTAIQKLNNKVSALLNLEDKIHVDLFLSSSLETVAPVMNLDALPRLPREVEAVVERLNAKMYGNLLFSHKDPTRDPSLMEAVERHDLLNLKWPALSDGAIAAGSGAIGMLLRHGDRTATVPLLRVIRIPILGNQYEMTEIDRLEEILDRQIESLIDIHENIGVMTGFNAVNVSPAPPQNFMMQQQAETAGNFYALLSENYSVQRIDLEKEAIPDSIECLIIAGPKAPLSDYHLYQIDQFLMKGKSLALFLDAFNEVVPGNQQGLQLNRQPPVYVPVETGIEKLLNHYGLRMGKSYVMDRRCYVQQVPQQFGGGERPIYFAPMIENRNINHQLPILNNIKGFVAVKTSPLFLEQAVLTAAQINARHLFSSSQQSWEMKERINLNPMFIQPPAAEEDTQSFVLGYLLEGAFNSYFAGRPIPEKPAEADKEPQGDAQTEDAQSSPPQPATNSEATKIQPDAPMITQGRPGRILLIASSEMIKDTLVDKEGRSPNDVLIMNLIDYLNDREATALMRSKEQRFNPLVELAGATKTVIKIFCIVGLPVLVVVLGLFIWALRHRRRRHIREMF